MNEKINKLIKFFEEENSVLLAFIFGSRVQGNIRESSDWDIGIYLKPKEFAEIETDNEYDNEIILWSKIIDIIETDHLDMVILNRASSTLFYEVITKGIPLVIKDKNLYLSLLCKLSYETFDWLEFAEDYYRISEISQSIPLIEKLRLIRYLQFLENEFREIEEIKKLNIKTI